MHFSCVKPEARACFGHGGWVWRQREKVRETFQLLFSDISSSSSSSSTVFHVIEVGSVAISTIGNSPLPLPSPANNDALFTCNFKLCRDSIVVIRAAFGDIFIPIPISSTGCRRRSCRFKRLLYLARLVPGRISSNHFALAAVASWARCWGKSVAFLVDHCFGLADVVVGIPDALCFSAFRLALTDAKQHAARQSVPGDCTPTGRAPYATIPRAGQRTAVVSLLRTMNVTTPTTQEKASRRARQHKETQKKG